MLCDEDRVCIITKGKTYCGVKHKQHSYHSYSMFFNDHMVEIMFKALTIKAFINI